MLVFALNTTVFIERQHKATPPAKISGKYLDAETASLSSADRKLVRTDEMTQRVIDAAKVLPHNNLNKLFV